MHRFLTEERGDTTTGVALGAILVLLVIVAIFVFGGVLPPQPQQTPGVDIRVRT